MLLLIDYFTMPMWLVLLEIHTGYETICSRKNNCTLYIVKFVHSYIDIYKHSNVLVSKVYRIILRSNTCVSGHSLISVLKIYRITLLSNHSKGMVI